MTQLLLLAPEPEPLNPRYVAYCRAHGDTVEQMVQRDELRWRGTMVGFISWIGARWAEWDRIMGHAPGHRPSLEHHAAFDVWLGQYVQDAPNAPCTEPCHAERAA